MHTLPFARRLTETALDVLFPPTCAGCGRRAQPDVALCPSCLAGIARADLDELTAQIDALQSSPGQPLASAFALWRFDVGGAFQQAHHRLKYGGQPRVGRALGHVLGGALREADTWDAVVCVGQSRARYIERGYNQALPVARGVAEALGVELVADGLRRAQAHSQTRLSRSARRANVAHVFAAPRAFDGAALLLVDDVLTTGNTLVAGAQALREAGASRVDGAVLAWTR
jgi:ComF family protein